MKCVIIIGEGSAKLSIILGVPPLSLFNMFLAIKGEGSSTWFPFIPLAICPLWIILILLGLGVLPIYTFFSPIVGFFVLLIIGRFSSFLNSLTRCNSDPRHALKIYIVFLCHAIRHMLISSFNLEKMEPLLLFSKVFCLESTDIMNPDKDKV